MGQVPTSRRSGGQIWLTLRQKNTSKKKTSFSSSTSCLLQVNDDLEKGEYEMDIHGLVIGCAHTAVSARDFYTGEALYTTDRGTAKQRKNRRLTFIQ